MKGHADSSPGLGEVVFRPPGSEKLSGKERYRLRQGACRISYEVTDEALIVVVVKVGHRQRVYKNR